jgi:hypothetical protein
MAPNKPNSRLGRAGRGPGDAGRGASAPNKPNLGHGKTKGKWFAGKELWLSGPAKSTEKTKPNLGAPGESGRTAREEPIVQNKPDGPKRGTEAVSARAADRMDLESATVGRPEAPGWGG